MSRFVGRSEAVCVYPCGERVLLNFWFMDTWRAMRTMICLEIRVGHVEYVRSVGFEVRLEVDWYA